MKSNSLAVIGSKGMVGSDLTLYLKKHFTEVTEIDKDNYDQYKGDVFDVVINANGNSNKVWANENRLGDFEASTTSVYESLIDFPCKIYIYISSSDVYKNHAGEKEDEANFENLTPYGLHKLLSESIVRNFTKDYIILRCPMMLGTKLKKGPIFDIFNNSQLFISKDSSFQMITTKEIAQIILFLLKKNATAEIFNIGGKGVVYFREIEKHIGREVNFPKDGKKHTYEANVSKLAKLYPLKTSVEYLKEYLKKYILKP